MLTKLRKTPSQTIISLVAPTTLCLSMTITRIFMQGDYRYTFLVFNLFLAWIPFLLTQFLTSTKWTHKSKILLVLFIWFMFFPNAPYIITDLLHFKHYSLNILWFDSLLVFVYALTGLLLGANSLWSAECLIGKLYGATSSRITVILVAFTSGFGIYLGRFCRLSSWDLFHRPLWLLSRVFYQFENPLTYKVTIVYGLVLTILYLIFVKMVKLEDAASLSN